MDDPCDLRISALGAGYRSGAFDPVGTTEAYLTRIERLDPALHSYITVATDTALRQADESRRRIADGRPLGPLDGVPIAIKDNIDVAGLPCTAGTAAFRERTPSADARVVVRLRREGAVILGKLNMHEAALGATTDNPVYGRCMNPVRPGYTPGGSSGGSAAAVAARLCAGALGTDTMGSVRVPAAYCGVYGFKPSNDLVPSDGVVPLSFTLDCVGPLANSVEDISALADVLLDRSTLRHAETAPSVAGLRVGVPRQVEAVDSAPPVASAFRRFLEVLRAAGAVIVPVDLPGWHPTKARLAGLLISEAEGEAFYSRELGPDLAGLSEQLVAMLRYPARAGLTRVVSAYELLDSLRRSCLDVFTDVDVVAMPTTPQPSFPHGTEVPANQADFTALANFLRAPAISLPFPGYELPLGMQMVAAPANDRRLLSIAAVVDRVLAAHRT